MLNHGFNVLCSTAWFCYNHRCRQITTNNVFNWVSIYVGILLTWSDPLHIQLMCVVFLEPLYHSPVEDGVCVHVRHPPDWTVPMQSYYIVLESASKRCVNVIICVASRYKKPYKLYLQNNILLWVNTAMIINAEESTNPLRMWQSLNIWKW
jgi:hypothetical protein